MLKALRQARGLRQEDVADALNFDRTAIVKIEKRQRISAKNVKLFAEFYGVSEEELSNPTPTSRESSEAEVFLLRQEVEGLKVALGIAGRVHDELVARVEAIEALGRGRGEGT